MRYAVTRQLRMPRPERLTAKGEILLSHNHIALLNGLYDRPNGRAASRGDWVRAAIPHIARYKTTPFYWTLCKSISTVNPAWVSEVYRGQCIETTLTERGRAIVERTIRSRITGMGAYEGLPPGDARTQLTLIPRQTLLRIASYTSAFGIPLIESNNPTSTTPTLFAVSSGIDQPFRIQPIYEMDGKGVRALHYSWTRKKIERGEIPDGYLIAFQGSDIQDLRHYLRELLERPGEYMRVYVQAYSDPPILSDTMLWRWFEEEIDYAATDIDVQELGPFLRGLSNTYCLALSELTEMNIEWTHPVTRAPLGAIQQTYGSFSGPGALTATTPAAVSCFQALLAQRGSPIRIETRYMIECQEN